jgi:hypothetical protein
VLATRNPLLLFVFPGALLLRLAERQLDALLFQPPPRKTRAPSLAIAALSSHAGLALTRSASWG